MVIGDGMFSAPLPSFVGTTDVLSMTSDDGWITLHQITFSGEATDVFTASCGINKNLSMVFLAEHLVIRSENSITWCDNCWSDHDRFLEKNLV